MDYVTRLLTITNNLSGLRDLDPRKLPVASRTVWASCEPYTHSLRASPPSHISFDLDGRHSNFVSLVGFADGSADRRLRADFVVTGDGRVLAIARDVASECEPVLIRADVTDVQRLELTVLSRQVCNGCAAWLDAQLDSAEFVHDVVTLRDFLDRVIIAVPEPRPGVRQCIATMLSSGYAYMLDTMLASLNANGNCRSAAVIALLVDPDEECIQIAEKHGAQVIWCTWPAPRANWVKAAIYSIAQLVDAEQYLCIDVDTVVLQDLQPLFAKLSQCPPGSVLAAQDRFVKSLGADLGTALRGFYDGEPGDIALLGGGEAEARYPLVVNGGVFLADRSGMLALDGKIRAMMPNSANWIAAKPGHGAREQFLFNLALAGLGSGVEIDESWNVLTGLYDIERYMENGVVSATWNGRSANILHFAGAGRAQFEEWRGAFFGAT